jgi:hypothetical protein
MSSLVKTYVQPEQLASVWEWVRPKLLEIAQVSPEPWIPEDVYTECRERRAALWLALEENKPVAFAVMQPSVNAMHLWAGWAEWNLDGAMELAKEIAKGAGVKRLTFSSTRPGWEQVAPDHGFKPVKWAVEV